MKKSISLLLSLLLLTAGFCLTVSAHFGTGATVVAADVNLIKTGLIGEKLVFSDTDFKTALCLADFDTITVTKIPSSTEGTLLLGGRRVGEGRVIKRASLASLVFVPASDSVTECRFAFTVDGYAGGAEIECIMKFINKVNYAPEAGVSDTEATVKTQAEISLFGSLTATDPEGDEITYMIVSYPKRGTISLDKGERGRYCYTPCEGFVGTDRFTYVARDEYGNWSRPVSVTVRVNERMCEVTYADMEERAEYGAAVAMTAMGVMAGTLVGDDMYFSPDREVTRAEFVAMAMKAYGIRPDSTLSNSFFDDDGEIPASLRGYAATAQRIGLVNGDFRDGKLLFSPNEPVTKYEAAKIMAALIGADRESDEDVFASDEGVPVWARSAISAMRTLGIFDTEDTALTDVITRADTAEYLYRMVDVK